MSKQMTATIDQLRQNRSSNILKTQTWSASDINEMLQTYFTAKEIATETGDVISIAVLEEKISQLQEAVALRSSLGPISPDLGL